MFFCYSVYYFCEQLNKKYKGDYELAITIPSALKSAHGAHYLGRHILAEFFECDPNVLNNPELVEKYMLEAALECGATVVNKCFHLFAPHGVSGVVIISESHLAIHTWPEYGYAAVDLFTCGEKCDPKVAYEFLKEKFNSKDTKYSQLNRGLMNPQKMVTHSSFAVSECI